MKLHRLNSLRNRLSLAVSLVLLVAAALLALGLQEFPRRLVEDDVVSRLQRDADLLYVRIHDAADPVEARAVRPARSMNCPCRATISGSATVTR